MIENLTSDNIIQWITTQLKERASLNIVDLCSKTHVETMREIREYEEVMDILRGHL